MDQFNKAVERAKTDGSALRNWVQPVTDKSQRRLQPKAADLPHNFLDKVREVDVNLKSSRAILQPEQINSIAGDSYRLLRTRLRMAMQQKNWTKIGITSPSEKAGKTLTAINLALTVARDGEKRVFLIDADVRRPSVQQDLGIKAEHHVVDYMLGTVDLANLLVKPKGLGQLYIVPGLPTAALHDISDHESSQRLQHLIDTIQSIDPGAWIIVDLPPVLVGDDVITVAPMLDALLLIVRNGKTDTRELQLSAEALAEFEIIGSVLNDADQEGLASYGSSGFYGTK